ncbi:ABC-type transport auxiliary lipoprotein family protein [Sulfurovum sp. zt1-1]|uniref:ABC-type transport auxiliary lipoprotein family protein n=1 Tax=Sulfurovum zhangzhouensis TaxID=3019067 RepID=A0ABT7QVA4_9BACT|nr:ABC-type transport auxiliary lipoprotein family protein [Sulfurovum zhangzhouensis]MDM5270761.1 ABC-type transport auxiliary lipoprotein family protein [Sulfurovum zhangzhouensis]
MRLITGALLVILLAGCSTKMAPMKTYTLQTTEVNNSYNASYQNKTIQVMQPQSLKEKMSEKIYFSYSPTQQGAYLNSKWSNDLGTLVQGTLIHTLQSSGMFKGVVSYASTAQADYRLESTVFDFSHHVRGNASHAIVSIQFDLISTDTGKLIKSKRFSYMEATGTTDAEGYVKASNMAIERLSKDLLLWLK